MTATRPMPRPDEASMPFFDGARAGRLMLQRCECGTYVWPVKTRCSTCWSDQLSWQPAAGQGVLFSFSVVHQVYHPALADQVPYNVCLVELDEGVRIYSTVEGAGAAAQAAAKTAGQAMGVPAAAAKSKLQQKGEGNAASSAVVSSPQTRISPLA